MGIFIAFVIIAVLFILAVLEGGGNNNYIVDMRVLSYKARPELLLDETLNPKSTIDLKVVKIYKGGREKVGTETMRISMNQEKVSRRYWDESIRTGATMKELQVKFKNN